MEFTVLEGNCGTYHIKNEQGVQLCEGIPSLAQAHKIAASDAMYEALTHLTNRFKTAAMMSGLSLDYIEGELEESLKALAQARRE